MAWLTGWSYRKSHALNGAAGAGTNYQMKVIVHYGSGSDSGGDIYCNSHCKTDFGDVRFTDNDGSTLLDYWMESKVDGDYAIFWVEVADDLSSNQSIYVYYGKSDATDASNGINTFLLFDDFADGNYTSNPTWTVENGTWSAADYTLKETTLADAWYCIRTPSANVNCAWKYKFKMGGTGTWHQQYFEFMTATGSYLVYLYNEGGTKYIRLLYDTTAGGAPGGTILGYAAWTPDTNWHVIEIRRTSPGNMVVLLDGVEKINVNHTTIITSQYIRVGEDNTGTSDAFDEVFIRKYVSPEPSHGSWGSEETETVLKTVTDSLSLSDSVLRHKTLLPITDVLGLADVVLRNKTLTIADSVGASDVARSNKSPLIVTDALSLIDAILRNKQFTLTDTIALADLVDVIKGLILKIVMDSVGLQDVVLRDKVLALIDAVSLADAASTPSRVLRALDQLGLADGALVNKVLQFTESISLVEVVEVGVAGAKKTKLFLIMGDLAVQLTGE